MKALTPHNYKNTASKWMLAVVLLLGVFTFSGRSALTHYAPSPVQTTWIARGARPIVKVISRTTRIKEVSNAQNTGFKISCLLSLSKLHSKTDATRLNLCRNCKFSNTHKILFGLNKTISQNGKAEPSSVLA